MNKSKVARSYGHFPKSIRRFWRNVSDCNGQGAVGGPGSSPHRRDALPHECPVPFHTVLSIILLLLLITSRVLYSPRRPTPTSAPDHQSGPLASPHRPTPTPAPDHQSGSLASPAADTVLTSAQPRPHSAACRPGVAVGDL